jgi:hypothetical protein
MRTVRIEPLESFIKTIEIEARMRQWLDYRKPLLIVTSTA